MPGKMIYYQQLAEAMTHQIAGNPQEWARFLTTAARLYKYPYHEQLLIYAQRPDATACAGYDLWNNTMHRYVRRGSKGIALAQSYGARGAASVCVRCSRHRARTRCTGAVPLVAGCGKYSCGSSGAG